MSDEYKYIDVDDEQWDGTPRALREALDKAQKALRTRDQQITEIRDQQAASVLSDVLAGFKNPERVKRDLLAEKVNPLDNEAVTKWLESNADDYARAQAPAETPVESTDEAVAVPDYRRLNAPAEVGTPVNSGDKAAILKATPTNLSAAELRQWFIDQGL